MRSDPISSSAACSAPRPEHSSAELRPWPRQGPPGEGRADLCRESGNLGAARGKWHRRRDAERPGEHAPARHRDERLFRRDPSHTADPPTARAVPQRHHRHGATDRQRPAQILPGGRLCGDTKRMLRWFRLVDNRLIFGGRGAFGKTDSASAFEALRRSMVTVFPLLADTPIAYRWSGLVAMTLDGLPRLGQLDDRTVFAAGYNGTGVAMASLMGRALAEKTAGRTTDLGLIDSVPLNPIPFHAFRTPVSGSRRAGSNFWMLSAAERPRRSGCRFGGRRRGSPTG